MREAHALCVKFSRIEYRGVAEKCEFIGVFHLAPTLLNNISKQVDTVNRFSKVRGLFTEKPKKPQTV